ncbi:unnamed protein product [Rangifer tarandus platyrhynchus]|uniref:Uncharacterized protein n=2 Tax=Rangifer tarandus platyrhynchus TaxID=3082113 RepID=A0ACB0F3S3_RANTA|nr:unnamed protein product [Rangifer tarandus platyrhynchus]CAI9707595.1 unnamed protein product [Rangifer tarandus platyrhynchus]
MRYLNSQGPGSRRGAGLLEHRTETRGWPPTGETGPSGQAGAPGSWPDSGAAHFSARPHLPAPHAPGPARSHRCPAPQQFGPASSCGPAPPIAAPPPAHLAPPHPSLSRPSPAWPPPPPVAHAPPIAAPPPRAPGLAPTRDPALSHRCPAPHQPDPTSQARGGPQTTLPALGDSRAPSLQSWTLGLVSPSAFPSRPGMPHQARVSAAQSWPPRLPNPVPTLWRPPAHLARQDTPRSVLFPRQLPAEWTRPVHSMRALGARWGEMSLGREPLQPGSPLICACTRRDHPPPTRSQAARPHRFPTERSGRLCPSVQRESQTALGHGHPAP